ncbi:hypothetical protein CHLRE_01g037050v5 [Chlamydomonas reinhardtii]|uniref:Uncharacterized protein n=1 Tax=Chlamydomonas reinhardtii TaxID=3055 RepID=A8HM84_CHLRE|nr:uncharacterized protein CHLRE_01g037050v5 [Chlamydomonas reinhardtii]PNW88612.1 hypothetical protein CHLRE_01g037050v5 [Chlamydomonas reinhardtii]|eukprot:XP_001689648.1 predicted protein [Chlamydomonas reinhardtii]
MSSNYVVEYAKSGRAMCKGCNKPIADKALRLSVQSTKEPEEGAKDHRRFTNNRHIECLTKTVVANGLKVHDSADQFPGMADLTPSDRERVLDIIEKVMAGTWEAPAKADSPAKGKRKSDEHDEGADVEGADTKKKKTVKKGGKKKTKKAANGDDDDEDDY